jgi:predicted dehydrogenase
MMEKALRIGVIGLGRRWRKRYEPALRGLRAIYKISAVCDQVPDRAAREAKRLACDAATGPTQLLEREDVEAILLLDEQWFGLWPLELACQLGKPVLCGCSLAADDSHADALHHRVRESRVPVMMEMVPRFASVTERLHGLFKTVLGAPRLLCCDVLSVHRLAKPFEQPLTAEQSPVWGLVGSAGIPLLDWCAGLLAGEPLNVMARSLEGGGFSMLFLEFAERRGVQLTRRCQQMTADSAAPLRRPSKVGAANPWRTDRPRVRLQILAEQGSAVVDPPGQVSWSTHEGLQYRAAHAELSSTQLLLMYFRDVVQGRAPLQPTFADAYRVLGWLRVAVKSRDEGRLLNISE